MSEPVKTSGGASECWAIGMRGSEARNARSEFRVTTEPGVIIAARIDVSNRDHASVGPAGMPKSSRAHLALLRRTSIP